MRGRVLLVVVLLGGCAPPVDPASGGPTDGGCFTAFPEELDFGEVLSSTTTRLKLRLTNHTRELFLLRAGPLAQPFFAASDGNPFVEPGGFGYFDVGFQPRDGRLHFAELEISGGERCVQRFPLRGLGSGRVEADRATLAFGGVDVGDTKVLELELTNTRRTPVTLDDVSIVNETVIRPGFSSPFSMDAPSRIELAPLSSITIRVTAAPTYGAAINARFRATGSRDLIRVSLTVLGGTPVAELSERAFDVPIVEFTPDAGTASFVERTFLVRNTGVANGALPLKFPTPGLRVEQDDGGLAGHFRLIAPSSINGGSEAPVSIRYEPTEFGAHSFRLVLLTNEVERPEQAIAFTATSVSLPFCRGHAPTSEQFLETGDGGSEGLVRFTNLGTTRCVLDDLRLRDAWLHTFRVLDGGAAQVELGPGEEHVVSLAGPGPSLSPAPGGLSFHWLQPGAPSQVVHLIPP